MRIIVPRIFFLLTCASFVNAHAKLRRLDFDETYGGCDAAYETARSAWTGTLDSSRLIELRDGRCWFAKLEYLRAAWPTGKPGLPDLAEQGTTRIHAASALVDRRAVGSTTDSQWLAGFLLTYKSKGLDAFRLFHSGELPTAVVAAAGAAGLSEAANACDYVCKSLRAFATEPQDVPSKVKYYLEMPGPLAIARLIDLGPSVRDELLSSPDSEPDALKREAQKVKAYFALRRSGDGRHEQVVASGLVSQAAKDVVAGERSRSLYRPNKTDLRSTLTVLFLKAWGWPQ